MNEVLDPQEICCPPFSRENWDDKIFDWQQKPFIKDKVCTFLYMPIGFGRVMKRLDQKVRNANATVPDWLCLADHTSSWNMDVYLAVDKVIPEANNVTLSGKFFSKVYEGSYQDTGKWTRDYEIKAQIKGLSIKKMFMWYTTCPKCAKKYGKNYVVILSEVD
jgi:hypothetical protein